LDGANEELEKFLVYIKRFIPVLVFNNPDRHLKVRDGLIEAVGKSACQWLSIVWIDADDAIMDGYFDYITSTLRKALVETRTADGLPWRGAVFAAREMPRLFLGYNRCKVDTEHQPFYSGQSQGQGFIIRRAIWESMQRPLIHRGGHVFFLKRFRELVMHGLGFLEYQSLTCKHGLTYWRNTERQINYEKNDESKSRIIFIDVAQDWNTTAIFVQSPFSSHFPWETWRDLPVCNQKHRNDVQKVYPQDIMYVLEYADSFDFTFADACANNLYLMINHPACNATIVHNVA
jgi:hypothetical protein